MVNTQLDHGSMTPLARAATLAACLALAIPVVAAKPAAATPTDQHRLFGRIEDQTDRPVPGVRISIGGPAIPEPRETRTGPDGRYAFADLPAGEYTLSAERMGFKKTVTTMSLTAAEAVRSDRLWIGSLTEMVSVHARPPGDVRPPGALTQDFQQAEAAARAQRANCVSSAVGGNIVEPRKVRDVRPLYSADLAAAGNGGIIIMEGRISTEGDIRDIKILRSVHPELEAAAIDAVSQWRYTPTLLNCEPVEVIATVTINFER